MSQAQEGDTVVGILMRFATHLVRRNFQFQNAEICLFRVMILERRKGRAAKNLHEQHKASVIVPPPSRKSCMPSTPIR